MSVWLSKSEVRQLTGWTARTIERKTGVGEIVSRISDAVSRNGKRHREYDAASLPPEALAQLMQRRLKTETLLIMPTPGGEAKTLPAAGPIPNAQISHLVSDVARKQALARYEALLPVIEFRAGQLKHVAFKNLGDVVNFIAAEHKTHAATVWRWIARMDKGGVAALADRPRSDAGKSRFFASHQAAAKFAQAKYLQERLSVQLTYDALVREWDAAKLSISDDDAPPSYEATRLFLSSLPKVLRESARKGDRHFNENFAPYLSRDPDSYAVNQIWVSDHRVFDVFVYNDCFPSNKLYADCRIWITKIIDMRSRLALGWAFSLNPSSESISSALRMAISQYGLPETFYVDNGKDFKKVGKHDVTAIAADGVLRKLGVKIQYCLPGHPQSKLVESFFAGMSKRFDVLFTGAYAGRKPSLRPEECEALRVQHKHWLEHRVPRTHLDPASDFIAMAEQWLDEYNHRAHTGRGMKGASPYEVFSKACPPASRRVPDMLELAPLFWRTERRRLMEGGTVQIFNERYNAVDSSTAALLALRIGTDIVIACDPSNLGDAIAMDTKGVVIGRLQSEQLVAHGPVSGEAVRESLRQRRNFLRVMKDYVKCVSNGVPSEKEYLRRRAGLPSTIDASQPLPVAVAAMKGRTAAAAAALPAPYIGDVVDELMKEED